MLSETCCISDKNSGSGRKITFPELNKAMMDPISCVN